jgi:hypothetical protein
VSQGLNAWVKVGVEDLLDDVIELAVKGGIGDEDASRGRGLPFRRTRIDPKCQAASRKPDEDAHGRQACDHRR